jgi:hypothetical protein
MNARPFRHRGQRITGGPVHDMHSPWVTLGVMGAVALAWGCAVTVAVWTAWGCGLPVGERKR